MALHRPYLRVIGPSGGNLVERFGADLIGVRITDRQDGETDECTIKIRQLPPFPAPPAQGTQYVVYLGWSESGAAMTGVYSLQRVTYAGQPRGGSEMHLVCQAADFIEHMKKADSGHFGDDNGHATYGDVLRTLAKRGGTTAVIAPGLDQLPLPKVEGKPYLLRWNQSAIDFANSIARDIGGVVAAKGDKLTVMEEGKGQSASGQALPAIVVPFRANYAFEIEIEARHEVQEVAAGWFDGAEGRLKEEIKKTSRKFSRLALPHPFASKEAAERGAAAAAQEAESRTGSGFFEMRGNPAAVADAPVRPQGFGAAIDSVPWVAKVVTHEVVAHVDWTTTVEVETGK